MSTTTRQIALITQALPIQISESSGAAPQLYDGVNSSGSMQPLLTNSGEATSAGGVQPVPSV